MADHKSEAPVYQPDDGNDLDQRPLMASERRPKPKNEPPESPSKKREVDQNVNNIDYKFLDGLRGIGAFVVYITHFLAEFFPVEISEK